LGQQNCCHDRQENEYGKLEILGVKSKSLGVARGVVNNITQTNPYSRR
jgi:hypothetical protein